MNARTRRMVLGMLGLCLGFDWPGQADRLAADLDAAGPRERREIVRLLAATSSEEARPAILKACSDVDVSVRREALRAAGRTGATEATPILLRALSDPDPTLRATAAEALGALTVGEAIQPLSRALADSEASVRRAAVAALAKLPQGTQQPALIAALDDSDAEVRVEAVRHLASATSERARDALLGKTRDASPEVRVAALNAVAGSGDARAALALSQALDDHSDAVVLAAIRGLRGLGSMSDADSRALIAPLTRSVSARVAAAAELSLAQSESAGAPQATPVVTMAPAAWIPWLERTAYSDADAHALIEGLERTLPEGEELALDPLLLYLATVPNELRARVVALIGRTHAASAVPTIVKLLDDRDSAVRSAAATSLAKLGDPAAVNQLLPRLADSAAEVRASAAYAVGRLADRSAFRTLLKRTASGPGRSRQATHLSALAGSVRRLRAELSSKDKVQLLSVLSAALRSADAELSNEAAKALGELGDAAAVSALSSVSAQARVGLRVAAARAMLRADAATALPALRTLASDSNVAVRATAVAGLGLAGDARDVARIERAGSEGPWPLGPVAAFALSSLVLRDHAPADALCPLLRAKEPLTRANAGAGLNRKPSTQCARPEQSLTVQGPDTQQPPFATWRALMLTDGRVLISHPDALGKVDFTQIEVARGESPWRLPYGVR